MTKILCTTLIAACYTLLQAADVTSIIPAPVKVEAHEGQFQLTAASRIIADAGCQGEAQLLAARLRTGTGFALKIMSANTKLAAGDIVLTTNGAAASPEAEGYELTVSPDNA